MASELQGLTVAILVADGFEQIEMTEPRKALDQAGAKTVLISPSQGKVKAWKFNEWGELFTVDKELDQANPDEYGALLLPGGVMNPDRLRINQEAINFVKSFARSQRPIAVICHGPWTLINAEAVRGVIITSWPSLQVDLVNAGAHWVDKPVVRDENIVSSRKPDDIPAFNTAMLALFAQFKK